jgi:nucleotide-binding universal stress UspA family protein
MQTILIAIDSSAGGAVAARHVATEQRHAALHLLAVEPPIRSYAARFLNLAVIREHQRAAAAERMAAARRILDEAGLTHTVHILVGDEAASTAALAQRIGADEIVMGDGADGWIERLLFRMLAARVIRRASMPVLIVKEPQRTPARVAGRWGFAFSR